MPTQHSTKSPGEYNEASKSKKQKSRYVEKKDIKLFLFIDRVIYIENLNNFQKKLLELKNEVSRFASHMAIYKSNLIYIYIRAMKIGNKMFKV